MPASLPKILLGLAFFAFLIGCEQKLVCSSGIRIYAGASGIGDSVRLVIDDGRLVYRMGIENEQELFERMSDDKGPVGCYLPVGDSMKVEFMTNHGDTLFFVPVHGLQALMVNQTAKGTIFVATDKHPHAWAVE
jgi:hypothetical protein